MEEGPADVLAHDALPRRGRARPAAQTRQLQDRPRQDAAECPVEHRVHSRPGNLLKGLNSCLQTGFPPVNKQLAVLGK